MPATTRSHPVERYLFAALLALLFWLPIPLGSHRPWAWALMEVWSFGLLALWLGLNIAKPRFHLLRPYLPLLLLFGGFQLWVWVQQLPLPQSWFAGKDVAQTTPGWATLSTDPNQTHIGLLKGLSYCSILLLMLGLVNTSKRLKALLWVVVLTGTFQACYGVLLALSGSETTWVMGFENSRTATGSFRYKNHFGNFLVLCLCLGIGLLVVELSAGGRFKGLRAWLRGFLKTLLDGKAVVRLCLAMIVIGLVMSHSRMANVAFFSSLSITGLLGLLVIRHKSRSLTVLLASLLLIDLLILGNWFGVEELKERLENTSLLKETRDEVNQYGLTLIERYPLTGTGGGSFYSSFPSVKGPGIHTLYDQAHNDYLQFALEFGLPACLLLVVAVLWSFAQGITAMRQRRSGLHQGLGFACVMAIIAEAIMLTTDFHLQAPATAVYFMLCLGLAWKARLMPREGEIRG